MKKYKIFTEKECKELSKLLIEQITCAMKTQNTSILEYKIHVDKDLLQQILQYLVSLLRFDLKLAIKQGETFVLRNIDLSEVSFDNIDVSNINFEGTNASIDPQTVFQKSLYYTNVRGLNLKDKNFTGVCVEGADLQNTNASIDPQTVYQKSLNRTKLKGLNLEGKDFKDVDIRGANLEDTNASIDPQTVFQKSLYYTNARGLDLKDKDFSEVELQGSNLENTNATINPTTVRNMRYNNLNGCYIEGVIETADIIKYKIICDKAIFENNNFEDAKKYIKSLFNM